MLGRELVGTTSLGASLASPSGSGLLDSDSKREYQAIYYLTELGLHT